MDAVTAIMEDHRRLESPFEKMQSEQGSRRDLLEECAVRLTAHSKAEEQFVYPAVAKADPSEKDDLTHGTQEHHEAERMLKQLRKMRPDAKNFNSALTEFINAVKHHVEEEESQILPALREAVDKKALVQLGKDFEEARMREIGSLVDADPGAGKPAAQPAADPSRTELYEQAQESGIPGRSKMTKQELAQALKHHAKS